jgi:hypothetical protein
MQCPVCGSNLFCPECKATIRSYNGGHLKGCKSSPYYELECPKCLSVKAKMDPWIWDWLQLVLAKQESIFQQKLDDHEVRYKHEYGSDNW